MLINTIAYDIDKLLSQASKQTHLGGRSRQTIDFGLQRYHALKTLFFELPADSFCGKPNLVYSKASY